MAKRNNKHERRVKKLIVGSFLCAVLFAVSTYAWFIGMKTVNVNSFDVTIAAIDSLSLSLDGDKWDDTIIINAENYSTASYAGNTNSWGGDKGLIPMSSVGIIDAASSRLTLFEKGSFTATPGGYRVMASKVNNQIPEGGTAVNPEQNGYVAFDLFIKNLSGKEYYTDMNKLNEEAIYLTLGSEVKVGKGGVENTGIENSVRVAFAQIGRVVATETDVDKITGITCKTENGVTGICADRVAQIWEPNDTKHVDNAINWYNTSCKARTGDDLTLSASYAGTCGTIENGKAYKTYAISKVVDYSNRVDVYDGTDYNGYTKSVATLGTETATLEEQIAAIPAAAAAEDDKSLIAYPYFTDTMKELQGTKRPTFITLAPNSITKVRIYIYIEGQDVDNYDFASLGKQISVAFGFTKERFYGEDVDYDQENTAKLPGNVIRGDGNSNLTPAEEPATNPED